MLAKKFNVGNGIVEEKVANPFNSQISDSSEIFAKGYNGVWNSGYSSIKYNNKGLPVSRYVRDSYEFEGYSDKSLKDLRNMHLDIFPDQRYANPILKLSHLDKRLPGDDNLNALDKFLTKKPE